MTQLDLKKATSIMVFYAVLSCFIAPVIGYNITKTKEGLGNGFLIGSILSIILWYTYGSKQL